MSCIRVVDLETGPDPIEGEPGIIEVGFNDVIARSKDLIGSPVDWEVFRGSASFVNPGRPIPPETSAVHNIIDEDVAGAPTWANTSRFLKDREHFQTGAPIVAFAAHNAEHESKLLGELISDVPIICTYKVALRLWPHSMSFSNNGIRYLLNPTGLDRAEAHPTHRAYPDSYVTAFTLREALNAGHSIETLIKWTKEPGLLPRCKIGDYRNGGKGTPWADIDDGMLHWIIRKMSDDPTRENDVYTARHHLEQREIDRRLENERIDLDSQFRANGIAPDLVPEQPAPPGAAPVAKDKELLLL